MEQSRSQAQPELESVQYYLVDSVDISHDEKTTQSSIDSKTDGRNQTLSVQRIGFADTWHKISAHQLRF